MRSKLVLGTIAFVGLVFLCLILLETQDPGGPAFVDSASDKIDVSTGDRVLPIPQVERTQSPVLLQDSERTELAEDVEELPTSTPQPEQGVFSGRVVDEAGDGVPGAVVSLVGAMGALRISDADGAFRLSAPDGMDTWGILATHRGYPSTRLELAEEQRSGAGELIIVLFGGERVEVTVVNSFGEPVGNAACSLKDSAAFGGMRFTGSKQEHEQFVRHTLGANGEYKVMVTNASGVAVFNGTPPGDYSIEVTAEGYITHRQRAFLSVVKDAGELERQIELLEGLGISGRVLDLEGNPVTGAVIEGSFDNGDRRRVNSGPDGEFNLCCFVHGRGELRIKSPGFATHWEFIKAGPIDRNVILQQERQLTVDISRSTLARPEDPVLVRFVLRENCSLQLAGPRWQRVTASEGLLELGTLDSQIIAVELPGPAGGTERIDTKQLWTGLRIVELNIGDSLLKEYFFSVIGPQGGWVQNTVHVQLFYSHTDEDGLLMSRTTQFMLKGDGNKKYRITGEQLDANEEEDVWIRAGMGAIKSEDMLIKTAGEEVLPGPWVLRLNE